MEIDPPPPPPQHTQKKKPKYFKVFVILEYIDAFHASFSNNSVTTWPMVIVTTYLMMAILQQKYLCTKYPGTWGGPYKKKNASIYRVVQKECNNFDP